MGDNVNNHIKGQLYVLNYRQFGDRKDKNSIYYSGKSAVMKDGVLYNSTGLYNVQQSTNYQLRMPFRQTNGDALDAGALSNMSINSVW